MRRFILAALLTAIASPALADDIKLKPGPGLDKLEANCQACHTLAYIPMNSPFLSAAGWDAEVAKMRGPYGAPIDDADAKAIAEYLKANYGG
jgi:mono/diheme cytochrome c family protein